MKMVKMPDGTEVGFEGAEWYMNDDIRDELVIELGGCGEQEFLDEYCKRHKERFNEEFSLEVAKERELSAYDESLKEKEKEAENKE
ncbi:MAG: hypothetical protein JXK94_11200 [Deltaproteobacteria bacterium]|nr:hypothetical protein [Deltaproteobacteria bacterium]